MVWNSRVPGNAAGEGMMAVADNAMLTVQCNTTITLANLTHIAAISVVGVEGRMQRRYQALQLHDALSRRNDYVEACRELRCVLRAAYVYAPEPFQALLYEDVVHAFRILARMENSRQLGAAKSLLQTVEDLFRKQRLASAAHEYETAILAWHRQCKSPEPLPERLKLSGDILLHVFEYLDARSLATASSVCREWNVAATEDTLWHTQYLYLFGAPNPSAHRMTVAGFHEAGCKTDQDNHQEQVLEKLPDNADCAPRRQFWRKAFNLASKDRSSHLFTSGRAYCPVCKGVLWLDEPAWKSAKGRCVARNQILEYHSPKPMSVGQVVRYVISRDTASASEPSSNDSGSRSDSDEDGRDVCVNKLSLLMECTNFRR